jgi:hypothetical protein
MTSNPYEPPGAYSAAGEKLAPDARYRRELCFLLLATLCFFAIGSLGAAFVAHISTDGQLFIGEEGIILFYWLRWGGKIVGRLCGDLLCGFVMGRYLQLVSPLYVLFAFVTVVVGIIVFNRGFLDANDGLWRQSVGVSWCGAQLSIQVIMMALVIYLGVRFGRRSVVRSPLN